MINIVMGGRGYGEVGELVDAFEELRDSIDKETGNIIIKVKGDNSNE